MKIVFATNNQHKLSEIRSILGESIEVLSLKDIGCDVDIPETGKTLEANALQKAQYVYRRHRPGGRCLRWSTWHLLSQICQHGV